MQINLKITAWSFVLGMAITFILVFAWQKISMYQSNQSLFCKRWAESYQDRFNYLKWYQSSKSIANSSRHDEIVAERYGQLSSEIFSICTLDPTVDKVFLNYHSQLFDRIKNEKNGIVPK